MTTSRTWRAFALGGVLHNRRMATAVRRVVRLAVVRPVVEHASTVWRTTAAQQQRLEQVQTRVLRRILRGSCVPLRMMCCAWSWDAGPTLAGWTSASWSWALPRGAARLETAVFLGASSLLCDVLVGKCKQIV
jgi:hypothetical protein